VRECVTVYDESMQDELGPWCTPVSRAENPITQYHRATISTRQVNTRADSTEEHKTRKEKIRHKSRLPW
jgi:hypothetical protein